MNKKSDLVSIFLVWVAVFVLFYLASYLYQSFIFEGINPHIFVHPDNLSNLLGQTALVGILASGMTLVIVSGQIDLSVGSAMGMLGAVAAWLMSTNMGLGWPTWIALPVTILAGVLLGLLQGGIVAWLGVPAFIVTLGGLLGFKGLLLILAKRTIPIESQFVNGLGSAIVTAELIYWVLIGLTLLYYYKKILPDFSRLKITRKIAPLIFLSLAFFANFYLNQGAGVPLRFVVMTVIAGLIYLISTKMKFGRYVTAIGSNSTAAYYAGISVRFYIVGVFALMGAVSALAGLVSSGIQMAADPGAGELMELYAIAACVIGGTSLQGGKGNVLGSLLGALIMATIRNGLSCLGVGNPGEKIVLAIILLIAVSLDLRFRKKTNLLAV